MFMTKVQTAIDSLVSEEDGKDDSVRATLLGELRADLTKFSNAALQHLDHEEHSFATPVARKVGIACIAQNTTHPLVSTRCPGATAVLIVLSLCGYVATLPSFSSYVEHAPCRSNSSRVVRTDAAQIPNRYRDSV